MKQSLALLGATAVLVLAAAAPAAQAANVGVSVQIGQPGVYGRIDIGRYPQPVVVARQPVIVQRPVVVVRGRHPAPLVQPAYLWVPPGHQKNWGKHCGRSGACNTPVYFVRDNWYRDRGPGRDWRQHDRYDRTEDRRDDRRDDRREDRRDDRRDERHGRH